MKNLILSLLTVTALCTLGACNHLFDDYNNDPNNIEVGQTGPWNLLSEVIFTGADGLCYRTWQINGELMQYTVHMYTENIHRYQIRESYVSGAWNHLARWAANADHMLNVAINKDDDDARAIALTMRALYMSNLVDLFGDAPFTEAFQARNDSLPNTQPKFDSQQDIYTALLEDLETANTLYSNNRKVEHSDKDLLYDGNMIQWRKFTNSLYLRLLTRLYNRDKEMNVTAKIAEIIASPSAYPIFQGNEDNATLFYTGVSPFRNRFWDTQESAFTSNARKMSGYFIDMLLENGDPRIGIFAKQVNYTWQGLASGYPPSETISTDCANLNMNVLGLPTSPYSLMRYDEILFIKAEMAYRGVIPGSQSAAAEYYREGVLASIEYWDDINPSDVRVTDAQKSQYLAKEPYDNTLQQIMKQKYIALFWCGYEAYHEYRRTGYPRLKIGTGTANDGILPTRLYYPVNTYSTNKDNYDEAVERMGGDNMKVPIWWSLKAVQ